MCTAYCQQVSRTVFTLRFQLVSRDLAGSKHAAVSTRAMPAYFQVASSNHEDWEETSASHEVKFAANAVEWRRVLSLARSAHIARPRVKMWHKLYM